ncbi:MAG TPA: hypothetical protein VNT58_08770, partial [Gaiellaceae bacterium]|nr:hypothetical protein [Gaiellaceae bacterium]
PVMRRDVEDFAAGVVAEPVNMQCSWIRRRSHRAERRSSAAWIGSPIAGSAERGNKSSTYGCDRSSGRSENRKWAQAST